MIENNYLSYNDWSVGTNLYEGDIMNSRGKGDLVTRNTWINNGNVHGIVSGKKSEISYNIFENTGFGNL